MLPFTHLSQQVNAGIRNGLRTVAVTAAVVMLATGCASGASSAASESAASASAASESAASESAASESAAEASAYEEAEAAEREVEAAKSEAAASSEAAAEAEAEAEASREAEAAASESAQAEKEAGAARKKKIADAPELSARELQRIVKSPDDHITETVVVYGTVSQFDAATGECTFRADIGHTNMRYDWDYEHNSMFVAGDLESDCPELDDVLQDDEVRITATVLMAYTYDTSIGGSATVPLFTVEKIERI
ncbi:hypothetical protein [Neomicrococcus aestuarii]|uniref:hypothetical protein n=1 Tax=Neomicrococcus aestuarii TaxID=556325 RepID=UPI0012EE18FD|nr:hypothetical protein [Neomicrococcus aestuarii]